jgi:Lon protease-like protein
MFELPLFPLKKVLFPGMPISLHIFEPRYKQMVRSCLDLDQPFGVTLIRSGEEAHGPLPDPYEVGCMARIIGVEYLTEGRMNIQALGETRFRILGLKYDQPYLVGEVEFFPFTDANTLELALPVQRLRPWIKRYMEVLAEASSDINLDPQELPQDPMVLAYLAAVLLQVPPVQKQGLLASERVVDLVAEMHNLYRREVALLKGIFDGKERRSEEPFSMN